jgi:hypothetical protein
MICITYYGGTIIQAADADWGLGEVRILFWIFWRSDLITSLGWCASGNGVVLGMIS